MDTECEGGPTNKKVNTIPVFCDSLKLMCKMYCLHWKSYLNESVSESVAMTTPAACSIRLHKNTKISTVCHLLKTDNAQTGKTC